MQGSFRELEPYTLSGIQVTDRELGRGSYAAVVEIEYRGLKCAGKKIHQAISQQGLTYSLRRFAEECRLLSQMRHPNVVQFLGVHLEDHEAIPILVMEYLPTNLSSCIDEYGILPKEINYSILHDVSLGLSYLHNQTPPIIHRDLSANNVLLTSNMMAKISDLGVARILNLTPLQMSRMTETPGTPSYMPPEVMVADPKYNTSVDLFSYGIMMIHIFSGKWPHPNVGQVRIGSDGQLIPVSEAERREEYLRTIGHDHPLMDLILKCVKNDPKRRGNVSEIVQRLKDAVVRFPPSFANKVEMLSRIEALEEEKKGLVADSEQKDEEIQKRLQDMEREIAILKEPLQEKVEGLGAKKVSPPTTALLEITIAGETYTLTEFPNDSSELVKSETENLLGLCDLTNLVCFGSSIRMVYNGVRAAGPDFSEQQLQVYRLGHDVSKLCDKSALTVSKIQRACSSSLVALQDTIKDLLENLENVALTTLSSVLKLGGELKEAAQVLGFEFEQIRSVVEARLLEMTQCKDQVRAEAKYREDQSGKICAALHLTIGVLQQLAILWMKAAHFWKQMGMYCQDSLLNHGLRIQEIVEKGMKFPQEKRLKVWTSAGFKIMFIRFPTCLVALDSVCKVYTEHFNQVQQDVDQMFKENPTHEESFKYIKEFTERLEKEMELEQKESAI